MRFLRKFGLKTRVPLLFYLLIVVGICLTLLVFRNIENGRHNSQYYADRSHVDLERRWAEFSRHNADLFDDKHEGDYLSLNLLMYDGDSRGRHKNETLLADRRRQDVADRLWQLRPQGDKLSQFNIVKPCTRPRHNITFLKIHKTGSSTVQNMLLRYGRRHNLKFVLPPRGHYLGYPYFFQKSNMLESPDGIYNIFCHHTRFNNHVITEIMPPNTIFVTILRDPVTVFESAFTYFLIGRRCGYADDDPLALQKFLEDPRACYNRLTKRSHVRNNLFFDFGMEEGDFDSDELIDNAIRMIDQKFSLVMIAEYFEESIILLKNLLCWDFGDIKYFKMNARNEESIKQVTDDMKRKILSWNSADKRLYDYFNQTFWRKVKQYGLNEMTRDVSELREINQLWKHKCLQSDEITEKGAGNFKIFQPPGVKINNFQLRPEAEHNTECKMMVLPEIQFTSELRKRQFPQLQQQSPKRKRMNQRVLVL
ncbi:galactosylceramide sulfotransferase-like [Ptychodera flava]|uniref:galactosylceramide sulfotransferase-like n=1 Tax=Ptychodera flava TaxID=63121 RepID=UPI003969BC02